MSCPLVRLGEVCSVGDKKLAFSVSGSFYFTYQELSGVTW